MAKKKSVFVDDVNLEYYEDHFSDERLIHRYPNANTVRGELWYFRKECPPVRYWIMDLVMEKKQFILLRMGMMCYIISALDEKLPFLDNFFDFIHSNQTIYRLRSAEAICLLIN